MLGCPSDYLVYTTQKIKFSIKDFFSKCDQIRRKLRIWSHLLKKFLMENFVFLCCVNIHVVTLYEWDFTILKLLNRKIKLSYIHKYNFFLALTDRLSSRNDVTSDKVNFWPDIRQNFFLKKNQDTKGLCGS